VNLERLRVRGWRNVADTVLTPGPRATVLHGQNGQGKTNLVEAAYFAITFRSFRTNSQDDLVGWGGPGAFIEASIQVGGLLRKIEVRLAPPRRATLLDGKAARRDAPGLRGVSAVLFVPEDLLLPKASPGERRRFIDRAVFACDRAYYREAASYEKVLKSRNLVLRQGGSATLLDTYDEELARFGARVVMRRRALVSALAPRVTSLFDAIHGPLGARIRYKQHEELDDAQGEEQVRGALLSGLGARRERDLRRGFTGFGPHTHDLEMELAGHPAREHGSQGQLRSFVLALKLAELTQLQEATGEAPLLLLDDVASELDEARRAKLFETIARLPGQTLITVTDPGFLPALPERLDFEVRGGRLTPA
jgi:DNA replication and repair protein RecF